MLVVSEVSILTAIGIVNKFAWHDASSLLASDPSLWIALTGLHQHGHPEIM